MCLFYTQAKDKNAETHTSDSLINIAVNYFENGKDKRNLMKSYYYAASTWCDIGDSPRAQRFFLKALDMAKEIQDNKLMGLIYSYLGSIYLYQDMITNSLDYEKEAVKTLPFLTKHYDSAMIYNEMGVLYKVKKEYDKALIIIKKALSLSTSEDDRLFIYLNLGSFYRLSGERDSALYYLSKCIHSTNIHAKSEAYLNLASLEEAQNLTAFFYYREYRLLQDTIAKENHNAFLIRAQEMFNYGKNIINQDYKRLE